MERKIEMAVTGQRAQDGAGVSLVRVLGAQTARLFDPVLMLDSFDSTNAEDYVAGFPLHPHRGIETISYLARGKMVHRDSLGNEAAITDGEVQWMNSGSGIMHEEMIPASERLLGVQLWLNLPAAEKMSAPSYHSITCGQIEEIPLDGGVLRLLAGGYEGRTGHLGGHLPVDYYDLVLSEGAEVTLPTKKDASVMLFTLLGEAEIAGEHVAEKTAVKLGEGELVRIRALKNETHVLFFASRALDEPIAWAGPIVMNTNAEVMRAFDELERGTFVHEQARY